MTEHRIWPATDGPNTSGSDGTPINLATEFYVTATGWVTHARFYRGTTSVSPDDFRLYRIDSSTTGTLLASVTPGAYSGTGWQEVQFGTPIELVALQAYKVVSHNPDHYTATGGYFASGGPGAGGVTDGFITAPDTTQSAAGAQGTFAYGAAGTYPTGTFNGGNYWIDVVVTDVDPSAGGAVDLDGSASSAASFTGALTVARSFTGASPDADSGGGEMGAARDVSGVASAASALTGAAGVSRALTGALSATASATGALTVTDGSATAYSFTAGRLSVPFTPRRISTPFTAGRLST